MTPIPDAQQTENPLASPFTSPAIGPPTSNPGFRDFYRQHFLPEHQHPANVALHVGGTVAGIAFAVVALASALPYLVLLFPVVHAVPGLVGHRLFERNAAVGDVRVLRKDFSPLWFIAGNHVMAFEMLLKSLRSLFTRSA